MTARKTITIQPGQPGEGMDYNVRKPLPYPIHVDPDTDRARWGNEEYVLIGFQWTAEDQTVAFLASTFYEDPQVAVGTYPVFADGGRFFNLTTPITRVSVAGEVAVA